MIGKAYVSTFKYYNNRTRHMEFKSRPVLIVGRADESDYVILPVSRITNHNNIDYYYDVLIEPADVPLMKLSQCSYIRTHKQSVVHLGELIREIVDFRNEYEDIYLEVISKMEEFQKNLIINAL